MQSPSQAIFAELHPHDLISQAQHKLELFNTLLLSSEAGGGINLSNPVISDGVYWLLDGIARELQYAVAQLNESENQGATLAHTLAPSEGRKK